MKTVITIDDTSLVTKNVELTPEQQLEKQARELSRNQTPEEKQQAVGKHDPQANKGPCQITGIMTTKKWKGIFICPEMQQEAQKIMGSTLGTSKRSALNYLKEQWNKQMIKKFQDEQKAKEENK